jgi:hypothetical protein
MVLRPLIARDRASSRFSEDTPALELVSVTPEPNTIIV